MVVYLETDPKFLCFVGVGDTLRGTMLGTVDNIGSQMGLRSKNDEIAQQGKLEIQRGMENWKGTPSTTPSAISPSQSAYGQHAHDTTGSVAGPGAAAPYEGKPGGTTEHPGLGKHIILVVTSNLSPTPPQGYASGDEDAHASTGAYGPGSSYPTPHHDSAIVGTQPEPRGTNVKQPRSTRKFGSGFEHDSSATGGLTEGRALDQQQYPPPTHYGVTPHPDINQPQAQHQPNPTGTVHPKT